MLLSWYWINELLCSTESTVILETYLMLKSAIWAGVSQLTLILCKLEQNDSAQGLLTGKLLWWGWWIIGLHINRLVHEFTVVVQVRSKLTSLGVNLENTFSVRTTKADRRYQITCQKWADRLGQTQQQRFYFHLETLQDSHRRQVCNNF
jgi:hypothetical protein